MALTVGGLVVAVPRNGPARGADGTGPALGRHALDTTSTDQRATAPTSGATPSSAATTTTADVGALAQTDTEPTTSSAQFRRDSQLLWQAIVTDDPDVALGFFFPKSAYRQVKDIANPDGDYETRLVANFRTDVHDLHDRLGSAASTATFRGLEVPGSQAQWIQPGVEYNKGSYWRVFGSSLTYELDGEAHSLPVESLISWRGEWYVVHLGAIR